MAKIEKCCYADACTEEVSGRRLMCQRHWDMVPYDLQDEIFRLYQGPPETMDECQKAINAARTAVRKAIISEGKP